MQNDLLDISENNFENFAHVKSTLLYGSTLCCQDSALTILMPIYNHPKFLHKAISSAVNQKTNYKYTILIVDNDSKNEYNNFEIVKSFNSSNILYYKNNENIGAVGNWNRCVELASSKYITFLHDDDMLMPNTVEKLLDTKRKYDTEAIIGAYCIIDANDNILKDTTTDSTNLITIIDLLKGNICNNGVGGLFERDKMLKLGGFSKKFMPCLDYAFFSKYVFYYGGIHLSKSIVYSRLAENDSFQCYNSIASADKKIKYHLLPYCRLPSCLLKVFINLFYYRQQRSLKRKYAGIIEKFSIIYFINKIIYKPLFFILSKYNDILKKNRKFS